MLKKLIIFVIILLILLGFYFVYNYFTKSIVKAPIIQTSANQNSDTFKGPDKPPATKGPNEPPPKQ